MNPKYVASKEQAMELKEAGFPQESEFYWEYIAEANKINDYRKNHIPKIVPKSDIS